ncbi:MAG: hypothetical protein VX433_02960 [Candidatus Thermoplasmatota archaeon]|jgi:hypothetical protein|nr:hypothetical protein [Candidatus Thermoplasmatota archaeon]|tara:strand:- start:307 stop:732 length:426 start_codon:yes stop_codon:yes gene_type:complete
MGWKQIALSGGSTGALLAIFILVVFVLAEIDPGSFAGLCGGFFALSALSAYIVNEISKQAGWSEIGLKTLIPVAFITSIIPLFGPLFGLPNNEPITLATVVFLGAVGGAFWSLPFAGWSHFKGRKSVQMEDYTPIQLSESE